MKVLVTGSGGLIGSQAVKFYAEKEAGIIGIDNDMRSYFFGSSASTKWNVDALKKRYKHYTHINEDIRDEKKIDKMPP